VENYWRSKSQAGVSIPGRVESWNPSSDRGREKSGTGLIADFLGQHALE
jgi:hypothetical protein